MTWPSLCPVLRLGCNRLVLPKDPFLLVGGSRDESLITPPSRKEEADSSKSLPNPASLMIVSRRLRRTLSRPPNDLPPTWLPLPPSRQAACPGIFWPGNNCRQAIGHWEWSGRGFVFPGKGRKPLFRGSLFFSPLLGIHRPFRRWIWRSRVFLPKARSNKW